MKQAPNSGLLLTSNASSRGRLLNTVENVISFHQMQLTTLAADRRAASCMRI
jgi:hypothetical protein